jgi:hypothetical protein
LGKLRIHPDREERSNRYRGAGALNSVVIFSIKIVIFMGLLIALSRISDENRLEYCLFITRTYLFYKIFQYLETIFLRIEPSDRFILLKVQSPKQVLQDELWASLNR